MVGHAERGTHRIAYQVHGPAGAPPVLLVMGLALPGRAWEDLPARLAERFRVVVFDNRGTGSSSCSRRPYRMSHLADDAVAVLDAVGVEHASVFGISMGGMISLELALRHPGRVRALAIGCSTAGTLRGHRPPPRVVLDLVRSQLRPSRTALDRLSRVLVSDDYRAREPEGVGHWLRRSGRAAPASAALQVAAIATHDVHRRLARIQAPTLIVTGDRDRLVPPENSRRLAAAIPGARLAVLPGAGHCFPLERADDTARLLADFFRQPHSQPRAV